MEKEEKFVILTHNMICKELALWKLWAVFWSLTLSTQEVVFTQENKPEAYLPAPDTETRGQGLQRDLQVPHPQL